MSSRIPTFKGATEVKRLAQVDEMLLSYPIGPNDLDYVRGVIAHSDINTFVLPYAFAKVADACPDARPFLHAIAHEMGTPLTAETEAKMRVLFDMRHPQDQDSHRRLTECLPFYTEESGLQFVEKFGADASKSTPAP